MNGPSLSLTAKSSRDLLSQLAAIDITSRPTEGSTTRYREQHLLARLLATVGESHALAFPLRIEHREKPDFALHFPQYSVGVECVEAAPEEWRHIKAIRDREFPEAPVFLQMFKPGERKFTTAERVRAAQGRLAGPPVEGNAAERQWAEAIAYVVGEKTKKLRAGNYSDFEHHWLVVQEEWGTVVRRPNERLEAALLCVPQLRPHLESPSFSTIYVCSGPWLFRLAPGPLQMQPIRRLWR